MRSIISLAAIWALALAAYVVIVMRAASSLDAFLGALYVSGTVMVSVLLVILAGWEE